MSLLAAALLALTGCAAVLLSTASSASAAPAATATPAIGDHSAARSCPSNTVTGSVSASGLVPGGLYNLQYGVNDLADVNADDSGNATFTFTTDAVPADATSFDVDLQRPTSSGFTPIPVTLTVVVCEVATSSAPPSTTPPASTSPPASSTPPASTTPPRKTTPAPVKHTAVVVHKPTQAAVSGVATTSFVPGPVNGGDTGSGSTASSNGWMIAAALGLLTFVVSMFAPKAISALRRRGAHSA
ncbi:MAG: hypothetical protein WC498_03175 [Candidatus Saccharimonadales bacterium]